ncbi:MAG: Aspartokinase [Bathelium mastoideum]|nr:MAG: Aspartokinase [Bathelium mastoideum]
MGVEPFANGHTDGVAHIIPHKQEKNLPGGWIVQKFGGTSVGKKPLNIADIVQAGLNSSRIAVVCSARSSNTKSEGTTNRLLRAAREAEKKSSTKHYGKIVELIRRDHVEAAQAVIQSSDTLERFTDAVNAECNSLVKILDSAQHLEGISSKGIIALIEDSIVSEGEKLSCQFMTAVLQDRGVDAQYVDLANVVPPNPTGEGLDDRFYKSAAQALADKVHECGAKVPVITGYFGVVPGGLLHTVGRGYTDLCAGLVAVGLAAKELQVWKEVDGIFTADPRRVPTARLLPSVTPSEAAELTFYGSEVIHHLTMEQVIHARIPIRIKNVMNPRNNGTIIFPESSEELRSRAPLGGPRLFRHRSTNSVTRSQQAQRPKRPTAVTIKRQIVVLNVHSNKRARSHGFLMGIFSVLDKWHLSVDLISSSEVHVSMALHSEVAMLSGGGEEELRIQDEDLHGAVTDLGQYGAVDLVPNMAIVSLVGRHLRNMVGISGKFFSTLGDNDINVEMISQGASEINISCVIEERDADRALNIVHTNLFTFLE